MRSPTTRTPSDDSSSLASRTPSRVLDQKFQALIAQATGSQSPALNTMAFYDWMVHLMASPGKQLELWQLATQMLTELHRFAVESRNHTLQEKLAPLVGLRAADPVRYPVEDHRFADPAWQDWPFSLLQQGYLMQERWWRAATQNVPGVDPHHADWVSFCAHQWISMYSPANFALTNPMVLHRTKEEHGANLARGLTNFFDDMQRKLNNAPAAITEDFVVGKDLAATPGKVVLRTELMELIQYSPTTDKVRPEPVLIVPAWIMKYYILDLSPHNSMIRYLVAQGHTVFAISWKNPGLHEHNLGMEDYLREGLYAAIDAIGRIVPDQGIHACGYCLGGTLLSIGAAAMGRDDDKRLASVTLLAAQTDFSEPGELALFIDESQLNLLEAQMAERGYLDSTQMAAAFTWLRSYDLVWSRMVQEYLLGDRGHSIDLMAWNADATRMPARMHTEYLSKLFLHNDLARGKYEVGGRPVAVSEIRQPVFAVGTESDHVAPWCSVYKIHLLSDAEITFVLTSGGHNAGIVSEPGHPHRHYRQMTRKAGGHYLSQEEWAATAPSFEGSWWESWNRWLDAHSGAPIAPPTMGAPDGGCPVLCDAPGHYVLQR